jgi:hypothetical protein
LHTFFKSFINLLLSGVASGDAIGTFVLLLMAALAALAPFAVELSVALLLLQIQAKMCCA